jgi:hypothetical protein
MMRTSGVGREGWMTAVPLGVLVLFVLIIAGGPHDLLRMMERTIEAFIQWVTDLAS